MTLYDFASIDKSSTDIQKYRVDRFILYPTHWQNYPNQVQLAWNKLKFTKQNLTNVPNNQSGVYSFVAEAGIANHPACSYLLYIGITEKQNFRKRYQQYLQEPQKRKPRMHIAKMINNWSGHLWFYYAQISQTNLISTIEDDLITAFTPPYNYEYPANIRSTMKLVFS